MELLNKYLLHAKNEGVTEKRLAKLKQMFLTCERGLKEIRKTFETAKREDIEKFVNNLAQDQFKKHDGQAFSGSTKSDIKKFLKQFYKWLRGNNEEYPPEVRWIKTKIAKDEKPEERPAISIDAVQKIANSFRNPEYRILTLLLFDSGFRIQEMLSVKKRQLTWAEFNEKGDKCFWIECSESKTEIRNIPVQLFTEDLKQFCNGSYYQSLQQDDKLFKNISYAYYTRQLRENSKETIGKELTAHCLRHSSATLYAKLLDGNTMRICQRYGWAFNSKEVALYIKRSGVYQKESAKAVYSNEVIKLQQRINDMQERQDKMERQIAQLLKQKYKS